MSEKLISSQTAGGACRWQAARESVLHLTLGNKKQSQQTCAVAYMSQADSMLLAVLKSKDYTSV